MRDAVAVGTATGAYGLSFGALATAAGLSVWQTCALSVLMFTGASQFALIGVLGAGGGPLAAVATATLLGSRNAFYGLRLTAILHLQGPARPLAAHLVIDESSAMAVLRTDSRSARLAFWATGASVFTLWNLATLIGGLGARVSTTRACWDSTPPPQQRSSPCSPQAFVTAPRGHRPPPRPHSRWR